MQTTPGSLQRCQQSLNLCLVIARVFYLYPLNLGSVVNMQVDWEEPPCPADLTFESRLGG